MKISYNWLIILAVVGLGLTISKYELYGIVTIYLLLILALIKFEMEEHDSR